MSNLSRRQIAAVVAIVGTLVAVPFALYVKFRQWEIDHFREVIGQDVAVADAVFVGTESHFREGCGVVVFQLAPSVRSALAAKGAAAYDGRYGPFSSTWTPTPYRITGDGLSELDSWMLGFGCAGRGSGETARLHQALDAPGAFVKRVREGALIVVPADGIVGFVYNG